MRKPLVAGNWKMFTTRSVAQTLAADVVAAFHLEQKVNVAICPPFPYLSTVEAAIRQSAVALGAQNLYPEREGPFTGEISPTMLVDVGCRYVIIGHSERRQHLGESDQFINRKVKAGLAAGLSVILCVGETLDEREKDQTEAVTARQLAGALADVPAHMGSNLILAYEPVWAIGTGRNATPEQAQKVHIYLRDLVRQQYGDAAADRLIIQYGGSVKPDNAKALMSMPDIDGALVGGASLRADQFLSIVQAAALRD
jgi:triosephosphate isomerase